MGCFMLDGIIEIESVKDKKINLENSETKTENKTFTALDENDKKILELLESSRKKLHILYKQFFISLIFTLIIYAFDYFLYITYEATTIIVVIIIISGLTATILLLFSSFIAVVRLWWDRNKLKAILIQRFSDSFVLGIWIDNTRRIHKQICLVKNNKEIFYNKGLYLINPINVYTDEKKIPNLLYTVGNAESIKINNTIAISNDAQGLKDYRDAKFVSELMKESGNMGTSNILFIILGVIALLVLIFIAFKVSGVNLPNNINVSG